MFEGFEGVGSKHTTHVFAERRLLLAAEPFAIMCAYLISTDLYRGRHVPVCREPVHVSGNSARLFYRPETIKRETAGTLMVFKIHTPQRAEPSHPSCRTRVQCSDTRKQNKNKTHYVLLSSYETMRCVVIKKSLTFNKIF